MNIIDRIRKLLKRPDTVYDPLSVDSQAPVKPRLRALIAGIDSLLGVERVSLLTYEDAVKSFIREKPSDRGTLKGVLILNNAGFGESMVTWAYLDQNYSPILDDQGKPIGKRLVAASLDDELAECFSGSTILIME